MSEDQQGGEAVEAVQEEAQVEEATTKKTKAKGDGNLIATVAQEIEGLTKVKALNLAANLAENIETNYFKLGGVLSVISENSWFEGFESFDVFVYEKYGFQARKARYLMQIYKDLVTKQIPWEKVAPLGWTKLKDLAPILTLENVDEWVTKALSLSVLELQALLKAKPEAGGEQKTTDEIVTLKFKLKADQAETVQHALAKGKGEVQTEYDTVALENICALYLSGNGGTLQVQGDLKGMMKAAGWHAALQVFAELFPEIDLEVTTPEPAAAEAEQG